MVLKYCFIKGRKRYDIRTVWVLGYTSEKVGAKICELCKAIASVLGSPSHGLLNIRLQRSSKQHFYLPSWPNTAFLDLFTVIETHDPCMKAFPNISATCRNAILSFLL